MIKTLKIFVTLRQAIFITFPTGKSEKIPLKNAIQLLNLQLGLSQIYHLFALHFNWSTSTLIIPLLTIVKVYRLFCLYHNIPTSYLSIPLFHF